jgi:hypothetical protein
MDRASSMVNRSAEYGLRRLEDRIEPMGEPVSVLDYGDTHEPAHERQHGEDHQGNGHQGR